MKISLSKTQLVDSIDNRQVCGKLDGEIDPTGAITRIETTPEEIEAHKGAHGAFDVLQLVVENDKGLYGRFSIRLVMESGRPKIVVDTHKKSGSHPISTVTGTADWKL